MTDISEITFQFQEAKVKDESMEDISKIQSKREGHIFGDFVNKAQRNYSVGLLARGDTEFYPNRLNPFTSDVTEGACADDKKLIDKEAVSEIPTDLPAPKLPRRKKKRKSLNLSNIHAEIGPMKYRPSRNPFNSDSSDEEDIASPVDLERESLCKQPPKNNARSKPYTSLVGTNENGQKIVANNANENTKNPENRTFLEKELPSDLYPDDLCPFNDSVIDKSDVLLDFSGYHSENDIYPELLNPFNDTELTKDSLGTRKDGKFRRAVYPAKDKLRKLVKM